MLDQFRSQVKDLNNSEFVRRGLRLPAIDARHRDQLHLGQRPKRRQMCRSGAVARPNDPNSPARYRSRQHAQSRFPLPAVALVAVSRHIGEDESRIRSLTGVSARFRLRLTALLDKSAGRPRRPNRTSVLRGSRTRAEYAASTTNEVGRRAEPGVVAAIDKVVWIERYETGRTIE
jgi:hypothetical protein